MWFLRSTDGSYFYMWEKLEYTIGRKNTDIIISNDDSISRKHAVIEIDNNVVYLTDNGSKYGTFMDDIKLPAQNKQLWQKNTEVKFGLLENNQSKFKLGKLSLKIVTSNVKQNERAKLQSSLEFLKAAKLISWNISCTHIIASEIVLTIKILCALVEKQPIVNVEFFTQYEKAVRENEPPPKASDFLPEFNESLLNKNINLKYNFSRKMLFNNKTFVFQTENFRNQIGELIALTGGSILSWETSKLDLKELKSKYSDYLFVEEALQNISEESQIYKSFNEAVAALSEIGKRSIPFQEIALAIVHCSCEEYCNPSFNRKALLIPSTQELHSEKILAYDTQHTGNTPPQNEQITEEPIKKTQVVEPSFDDTQTQSLTPSGSVKRPLEVETNNSNAKKAKEDQASTSTLFSFRRSSAQSDSSTKSSIFRFPEQPEAKPSKKEDQSELLENPFAARKRKATENIKTVVKKTALEEVSNIRSSSSSDNKKTSHFVTSTPLSKNVTRKIQTKDISITECKVWFNNTSLKQEIKSEEKENIKVEVEDEKMLKFQNMFKNSIRIEFESAIIKKNTSFATTANGDNRGKNFKKFKKVQPISVQTVIITGIQMKKSVLGSTNRDAIAELGADDDNDDEGFVEKPKSRAPQKAKRRFQFVV